MDQKEAIKELQKLFERQFTIYETDLVKFDELFLKDKDNEYIIATMKSSFLGFQMGIGFMNKNYEIGTKE